MWMNILTGWTIYSVHGWQNPKLNLDWIVELTRPIGIQKRVGEAKMVTVIFIFQRSNNNW